MKTPFDWIAAKKQKPIFIFLVVLTVVVMVCLQIIGGPLATDAAPGGIVSFEFAGDLPAARTILDSWNPAARIYAGLSLGLDYLLMAAYAGSIGLGCVLAARRLEAGKWRLSQSLQSLGYLLAWGQMAAALLDSLENYGLIQVLLGTEQALWPLLARWCAIPKFGLVGAGLLFVIVGGAVGLLTQRQR